MVQFKKYVESFPVKPLFIVFTVLFFITPSAIASVQISRTQILMGDVPVTLVVKTAKKHTIKVTRAMEETFLLGKKLSDSLSEFSSASDISRINRSPSHVWISLKEPLSLFLLEKSVKASNLTEGAFDITFSSSNKHTSWADLAIDKHHQRVMKKAAGLKLGVSGIAKGLIVELMSHHLTKKGFDRNLVNAGGDVYASGTWIVGIRNPFSPEQKPLTKIKVKNKSVSTSGLYQRGSHIIDPHTHQALGKKEAPLWASVTTIGNEGPMTDALTTGFFLLPFHKIESIVQQNTGFKVILITLKKQVIKISH